MDQSRAESSSTKNVKAGFGEMVENKDIRKLALYSKDGQFDTSVEGAILSCFIHMTDLPVRKAKDI